MLHLPEECMAYGLSTIFRPLCPSFGDEATMTSWTPWLALFMASSLHPVVLATLNGFRARTTGLMASADRENVTYGLNGMVSDSFTPTPCSCSSSYTLPPHRQGLPVRISALGILVPWMECSHRESVRCQMTHATWVAFQTKAQVQTVQT